MDLKTLSNLKSKFVTREVGNELILVPLTGNVAQMNSIFTLNESAKFIWDNMSGENNMSDIETLMTETFEIDSFTARKDLEAFLEKLKTMLPE